MQFFCPRKSLLLYLFGLLSVVCDFNPFADNDLFSINWAGPRHDSPLPEDSNLEVVTVQTSANEKYQCVIPESQASKDASRKANYQGDSPDELMEKLFQQNACSYRIESYWTYELCHGRHIRQYHENKEMGLQKPKVQEFYLGKVKDRKDKKQDWKSMFPNSASAFRRYHRHRRHSGYYTHTHQSDDEETGEPSDEKEPSGTGEPGAEPTDSSQEKQSKPIPIMKIDGLELPYFSINLTDGSKCDLTGKPRKSHVMYICQPDGRGEIYSLKETSSCEYEIIVLTSVLCVHPEFKPKDPPVNEIKCHSVGKSPWRPKHLQKLETEILPPKSDHDNVIQLTVEGSATDPLKQPPTQSTPPKQTTKQPPKKPDTTIGALADKQLLRDFLNGDYCLHGGGGWWRHEFCYGKYAKQYHTDQDGQIDVVLGYWDKDKHLQWLKNNPGKKPKEVGSRKQLSLFYSGGDVCDLTGEKRYVEVKLKCLNKPQQPHAVTIYLVEPKSCEYILGVESPIFCDLLDQADSDGLLDHIKV